MSGPDNLSAQGLVEVLLDVVTVMRGAVADITHADQAVGDGDHGLAIDRGFAAAEEALKRGSHDDVGEVFETMGTALMMSMGGASGAIYGTFFRRAGKALQGQRVFDAGALGICLQEGLVGVRDRGGAAVGDKTLVDALAPAAEAASTAPSDLVAALKAAAQGAERGAESTRMMQAAMGRARALGERAVGHIDPGAYSFSLMLNALAQAVAARDG